jgi:hypothetical protein
MKNIKQVNELYNKLEIEKLTNIIEEFKNESKEGM